MNLTFRKLLFATVVLILLDIAYIWIRDNYGLTGWISPKTIKFWAKDIALVLAWVFFFVEKRKKPGQDPT